MLRITLRALCALLLLPPIAAQTDPCPGCPHQGLHHVDTRIDVPMTFSCGGSVRINVGPIEWRNPEGQCPAVVAITPAYDVPTRSPGSCTRAVARYTVQMRLFYFECVPVFIFRVFGTTCIQGGSDTLDSGTHYELVGCEQADVEDGD